MIKNLGPYSYKESERLGSGAFACVYKGINSKTKEEIAVKVFKKEIF